MKVTRFDKEKKSYIWLTSETRPTFYPILVSKNEVYELLLKYFAVDKNLTIIGLYSLIFIGIAISIVRPMIFGNTLKLGLEELPRSEILQMLLDAMHWARIDKDLLLEELLWERLTDVMRDLDLLYHVTDSNLNEREKNLYDQFKTDKKDS